MSRTETSAGDHDEVHVRACNMTTLLSQCKMTASESACTMVMGQLPCKASGLA